MIYLIRHGQTDWNIEKRTQGHTDIPLNEYGRKQAKELANKLKNLKIDKIISSDLSRAKETANIINEKFNKEIILDKRLREVNYGIIEGIPRNTLNSDILYTLNYFPEKLKVEPKIHIIERIKDFFDEFKNSTYNILVITHGGILRMSMYYLNNRDILFDNDLFLAKYNNLKINNTDIYEIDLQNYTIRKYDV